MLSTGSEGKRICNTIKSHQNADERSHVAYADADAAHASPVFFRANHRQQRVVEDQAGLIEDVGNDKDQERDENAGNSQQECRRAAHKRRGNEKGHPPRRLVRQRSQERRDQKDDEHGETIGERVVAVSSPPCR